MEIKEVCKLLDYMQYKEDDKKMLLLEHLTEVSDRLEYITKMLDNFDDYLYEQRKKQTKTSTEIIMNDDHEEIPLSF